MLGLKGLFIGGKRNVIKDRKRCYHQKVCDS